MIQTLALLSLLALTACGGAVQPGTPGHEPPSGTVNPVTGNRSGGNK